MSAPPPIVLQNSFCTMVQKFWGLQARLSCNDVRDLIASRKKNSQATSVTRLKLYESAIASRFVFSRKILGPATFDFCNTIPPIADKRGRDWNGRDVPIASDALQKRRPPCGGLSVTPFFLPGHRGARLSPPPCNGRGGNYRSAHPSALLIPPLRRASGSVSCRGRLVTGTASRCASWHSTVGPAARARVRGSSAAWGCPLFSMMAPAPGEWVTLPTMAWPPG